MECISVPLMLLVTHRGTLIVKSSSLCIVSLEIRCCHRQHHMQVWECCCVLQTGWRCCWSSWVFSCSSCSFAYAAVSAAHRSAAATSAAPAVRRRVAAQRKVADAFRCHVPGHNLTFTLTEFISKCESMFCPCFILAVMEHRMLKEARKAMVPWMNGQPIYAPISSNVSSQGVPILHSGNFDVFFYALLNRS